jgi:hypothetical protein
MWLDYREQFCNLNSFGKLNTIFRRCTNFKFQEFEEFLTPCGPATDKHTLNF